MALTRLSQLKVSFNIASGDATKDTGLKHFIARANDIIRDHCNRFQYGFVEAGTAANPTAITSTGHGLITGDIVRFYATGESTLHGSTGETVTVTDADTFTVPVDLSVLGALTADTGHYVVQKTAIMNGNGSDSVFVDELLPIIDPLVSVHYNNQAYFGDGTAFAATHLQTFGTDYVMQVKHGISITGELFRIKGTWAGVGKRRAGELVAKTIPALGNMQVIYWSGHIRPPRAVQTAAEAFIARLIRSIKQGGGLQSEGMDYYNYERVTPDMEGQAIDSIKSMLKKHKTWIIPGS